MFNPFDKPVLLLKLEGLAIFVLALVFYHLQNDSWYTFFWLFLLPDVALVFYVFNPLAGAIAYNLTHNSLFPTVLVVLGVLYQNQTLILLSLIWFAHIGFDRMLGYGLKYPDGFGHTHLGMIGRQKTRVE